jgi:hypothetical protein
MLTSEREHQQAYVAARQHCAGAQAQTHQALRVSVLIPDNGELIPPTRTTAAPAPKHSRLSRWAMSAEGQSIT